MQAKAMAQHTHSVDPQQIAQQLQQRKEANLAFFAQRYPKIYNIFRKYTFQAIQLNIDSTTGAIDIHRDGRSLYNGDAHAHARHEVATFKERFSAGKRLVTVNPPFAGEYSNPRFFHRHADALIQRSPLNRKNYDLYTLENFYPLMVFTGIGAGYHLEEFLRNEDVHHAIVVETDLDYFAASLYTIDWAALYRDRNPSKGRSLDIIVGRVAQEQNIYALIWNNLIHFCPLFPLTTFFYNHRANPVYEKPVERICQDLHMFLTLFGYYDDEINQLNNAVHNFQQGIPLLPVVVDKPIDTPIAVVGAGPSLDGRIEQLKAQRDKLIVVSCGSALNTLYQYGITPDVHVEMESHYTTYQTLAHFPDKDWLRQIKLIGPPQLSPPVYTLFDDSRMYFKAESSLADLFGSVGENVRNGTPTCTNAALALVLHHRASKVYLFGMDFGYRDRAKHHASGSIYYDDNAPDSLKAVRDIYEQWNLFDVEGVDGEPIPTSSVFYHAKRKVEDVLLRHLDHCTFYNCSDGAAIERSEWLSPDQFDEHLTENGPADPYLLEYWFDPEPRILDGSIVPEQLARIEQCLVFLRQQVQQCLDDVKPDLGSITKAVFKINFLLEHTVTKQYSDCYYFLRGTLWHMLYIGYSHALGIKNKSHRQKWIKLWKREFSDLMDGLLDHYRAMINKPFDVHSDPWLYCSIDDPEPPIPQGPSANTKVSGD